MISRRLLLVSLFAVYVAYMVYDIPIPDGVEEPSKLRIALATKKLFFRAIHFLDFIGVLSDYVSLRWLGSHDTPATVAGVNWEDAVFDGVPVRVFRPDSVADVSSSPAMMYYHGGGFVLGTVDTYHAVTAYFAREADLVVVSVEYRLMPENSQRDALQDCVTATKHLLNHGEKYEVDTSRVVVAGDSAGGNLAASVALYLRDEEFTPQPKLQLLIYPAVQAIDLELPSMQQNPCGPVLTQELLHWFLSFISVGNKRFMSYFRSHTHVPASVRSRLASTILNHDLLPSENKYPPYKPPDYSRGGSDIWARIEDHFTDGYSFPLMMADHANLPDAYILTAEYDMLRDDGYLYANKMRQDGVNVTHYNHIHGWHGMIETVLKLRDGTHVMDIMILFLKDAL